MVRRNPRGLTGCVALFALLLAGCASPPVTRFYTLSNLSEPVGVKNALPHSLQPLRPIFIEVLPVNVPERLARPQLVVRSPGSGAGTQISILEQDRWASYFNYELRDAFATGIANQVGAVNKTGGIRTLDQSGYRIAIDLSQFEAIVGDKVLARFVWTITRPADGRRAACYSVISEPVGEGIEGVVKGVQHVVANVVADVSKNLMALETGRDTTCAARQEAR